jgi:hypothetical protein
LIEWLVIQVIKADLATMNLSLDGADLISMRHHDNHRDFMAPPVSFGGWTNSAEHIYLNMERLGDVFAGSVKAGNTPADADFAMRLNALAIVHHELVHRKQFADDGGAPADFKTMIEYEKAAYASDVMWLNDPAVRTLLEDEIVADPNDIAALVTELTTHLTKFAGWTSLTTEKARRDKLFAADMLPRKLDGKPYVDPAPLYKTAPPP